jgi:hypothetical protein
VAVDAWAAFSARGERQRDVIAGLHGSHSYSDLDYYPATLVPENHRISQAEESVACGDIGVTQTHTPDLDDDLVGAGIDEFDLVGGELTAGFGDHRGRDCSWH